ncbi:MAG: hypothetical protein N2645_14330 [Clostridia bacterium]|nr:hypothetical protein [Clostridia bacterium]
MKKIHILMTLTLAILFTGCAKPQLVQKENTAAVTGEELSNNHTALPLKTEEKNDKEGNVSGEDNKEDLASGQTVDKAPMNSSDGMDKKQSIPKETNGQNSSGRKDEDNKIILSSPKPKEDINKKDNNYTEPEEEIGVIAKSDNMVSNQEKEKILKDLEKELDGLFDNIDNTKEIEEQDLTFE